MAKFHLTLFAAILSGLSASSFALSKSDNSTPNNPPTSNNTAQVIIYSEPSSSSQVVEKINPWQNLVTIYRQNDWIKVGDPSNGNTGWINSNQYAQAVAAANKTVINSYFVQTQTENGKPTQITAYVNGQKVDQQQAEKLLQ